MNNLKPLETKRRERYSDLQQIELATLTQVYKIAAGVLLLIVVALWFNAGWRAHQFEQQQRQYRQLQEAANNALWEIENGSAIEAANRLREGL